MANDPSTTQNSFSTILANFIRVYNNSLDTLQTIQKATISNSDTVTVNVNNGDGTTTTYSVPSFGYLKTSIDRIDNTISKLLGFDGSEAYIRLPDGTFKRIYQSVTLRNPAPVANLVTPTKFNTENNWFFESMMTPALKVSFDITPYVPQQESKIFVKRHLLKLDTDAKLQYFNNNYKGKNDINYVQFMVDMQGQNISYFIDEGVNDMPLSIVRYSGDFTVVNFEDRTVNYADGTSSVKRWYLLDKLTYTDNLSLTKDTESLRVGDRVIKGETTYEVTEIDQSTLYIRVRRLNGYDPLIVGEPVSIYSETFSPKLVNVGIGFDEYNVVFFRTVNDEANIISTSYSPGVAFYTNDLTTDTTTGAVTMTQFYQDSVLDFGNLLLSAAKENNISAVDGVSPDAPTLNAANFKVVVVNDHKLDQKEIDSIRKKQSDKVTLQSEITELEKAIDKKKEELNSRKFNSDTERRAVKNELDSLIREKTSKSSLYASIVQELAVTAQQKPAALDAPKYRIRGFFGIPNPKNSPKTGDQNVIQFITYYRYVRPDGSQGDVKQFDFTDENGQIKRGTYSNLNEIKSEIRKKTYDVSTGKYIWAAENIENADSVNINQIDIPISKGEKVEFFIKSVSEAGWPENPLLSDASSTITVEFPIDLASEDEATIALTQASKESVKVELENDLAAKGLDIHLATSFNSIEKYYAHDADVISSNFYTPEGNVISLYDKLKELQTRIASLEDRLNKVAGELVVYIIDPTNNTKTAVQNATVIDLFAGYYLDYTGLLPTTERRGAIVNRVYQIAIQNSEATPLQLVARFPGGVGSSLPTSLTTIPSFLPNSPYDPNVLFASVNDSDYTNFRKYDQTPIVQPSIGPNDTNNSNKYASAYYQSGQTRGQFIWSRYTDVGLVNPLYKNPTTLVDRALLPTFTSAFPTSPTVWDGAAIAVGGSPVGGGVQTTFCLHIDHPELNAPTTAITANAANLQLPLLLNQIDPTTGYALAPEAVTAFRHAKEFNLVSANGSYTPQLGYYQAFLQNVGPSPYTTTYQPTSELEYPDKFGFLTNDRYLIGSDTTGAYLFMGPSTFNQLNVNGIDARSSQIVNTGDENAILIPIIFQYRMEDYSGPSGGAGNGIVGGFNGTLPPKNITYVRRIGIDIYAQDESAFSFDVQVTATYKKTSLSQVIATATPSVNKQLQNIVYTKETIKSLQS
jgi:hypothetical protein